jgi:hypothetical protein
MIERYSTKMIPVSNSFSLFPDSISHTSIKLDSLTVTNNPGIARISLISYVGRLKLAIGCILPHAIFFTKPSTLTISKLSWTTTASVTGTFMLRESTSLYLNLVKSLANGRLVFLQYERVKSTPDRLAPLKEVP